MGEGWWLASDGKYYGPELHPDFVSSAPQVPPAYRGTEPPPIGSPASTPVWSAPSDATQQVDATALTNAASAAPAWATNAPSAPYAHSAVDTPTPWYQTWWAIVPGLFFCFPVGLILLWTSRKETGWKVGISVACALLVVASALSSGGSELPSKENASVGIRESTTSSAPTTTPPTTTVPPTTTTTQPPTTTTVPPATTAPPPPPPPAPPVTSPPAADGTVSQQNARRKESSYLEFSAFSRSGLIEQLQFEGFSEGDSTFGVDALDVDWNAQAAKKAASYLEFSSFSRSGLVDQLLFEGFSPEQADYGASTTGL